MHWSIQRYSFSNGWPLPRYLENTVIRKRSETVKNRNRTRMLAGFIPLSVRANTNWDSLSARYFILQIAQGYPAAHRLTLPVSLRLFARHIAGFIALWTTPTCIILQSRNQLFKFLQQWIFFLVVMVDPFISINAGKY